MAATTMGSFRSVAPYAGNGISSETQREIRRAFADMGFGNHSALRVVPLAEDANSFVRVSRQETSGHYFVEVSKDAASLFVTNPRWAYVVAGHEAAHVLLGHLEARSSALNAWLPCVVAVIAACCVYDMEGTVIALVAFGAYTVCVVALVAWSRAEQRQQEFDADKVSAKKLDIACDAIAFLQCFRCDEKRATGPVSWFLSHPSDEDRIRRLAELRGP